MTMESLQKILAEHPFTQGLDKRHLSLLTGCASNVRLEAGQRIFREGDEANQFYLVREGKLAIELFGAERGALTILTLGPGKVLGWSWPVPRIAGSLTRMLWKPPVRSHWMESASAKKQKKTTISVTNC
jgi:Cyclic nucleotide-binding domain